MVGFRAPAPAHDPRDRDNTTTDSWDPGKLGGYSHFGERRLRRLDAVVNPRSIFACSGRTDGKDHLQVGLEGVMKRSNPTHVEIISIVY